MSKVVFNIFELVKRSNNDPEAIIVLLYGLKLGYNKIIDKNLNTLCKYLGITQIPSRLFKNGSLYLFNNRQILVKYKTDDPMSYINNIDFIAYQVPISKKIDYLTLLSKRSISNQDNFIPSTYVDNLEQYLNNPLVKIVNDKIHFTLEE